MLLPSLFSDRLLPPAAIIVEVRWKSIRFSRRQSSKSRRLGGRKKRRDSAGRGAHPSPTLHPAFPRILSAALDAGFERVTVDSNGLANDPAPHGPDPRLRVRLSVEGSTAAPHDAVRGPGSFRRLRRTLDDLLRRRVAVEATLTVTGRSVHRLERCVGDLLSWGLCALNVHFVSVDDRARRAGLSLSGAQVLDAQRRLAQVTAPIPLRWPRLLVPRAAASELTCHRHSGDRLLVLPSGEWLGCPLDLEPSAPSAPSQGCPMAHRLLPDGVPDGYRLSCVSHKPVAGARA